MNLLRARSDFRSRELQREANYSQLLPRKTYKVNYSLRRINELEYEPLLISIGPYHHVINERFKDMEQTKELYFQSLCARRGGLIQETCFAEMEKMEVETRIYYASGYKELKSDEFVRMLTLDGCFIIELFRKHEFRDQFGGCIDDPIFNINFILDQLFRDLLLFENQLPLFVLEKLFELTKGLGDKTKNFVDLALRVLPLMLGKEFDKSSHHLKGSPHLLGLAYIAYLLPFSTNLSTNNCSYEDVRSASALREAGVKFKQIRPHIYDQCSFGMIKFTDSGVLEIPQLLVDDHTECLIRNFIACEQYGKGGNLHRITDYFIFMDCLINTSKDVELLRHAGIIANGLGDDESVSEMFNKLTLSVNYSKRSFYYAEHSSKMNKYCSKRWNVWKAKLRHDYFNSPWALFSFLAALTLLLLSFIQTTFTLLSYVRPKC